jgi:hypothetical protein
VLREGLIGALGCSPSYLLYSHHTPKGGAELATYPSTYRQTQAPGVLAAYMGRIGRGGLLSPREELELGRRACAGEGEARWRLM